MKCVTIPQADTRNLVSLCDTDNEHDIHFHLFKIRTVEDDKDVLLNPLLRDMRKQLACD